MSDKFLETNTLFKNGTSNSSIATNTTNGNNGNTKNSNNTSPSIPLIVDNAPYKPIDCTQTVILKAQRLVNDYDYSIKKDAFFTINGLRINIFDQKNPDSFVNSIGLNGLNKKVEVLQGSKNCLLFSKKLDRHQNISMCIDDKNTTNQILETFEYYLECSRTPKLKTLSEEDSLEKLLNLLNSPTQNLYKIPTFRKALIDSLSIKGVFL